MSNAMISFLSCLHVSFYKTALLCKFLCIYKELDDTEMHRTHVKEYKIFEVR